MSKVYVIKCADTGLCKIGRSSNVDRRLKEIESNSGFNCEISYVSESLINSSKVEAFAHSLCTGRKIGEWFCCATNEAISCVKSACDSVGNYGDIDSGMFKDEDVDFLAFWAVSGSFINEHPLAVIKYALDTFEDVFSSDVLGVCNRAYSIGSGGDVDNFVDRLDVQCFYDEMVKQK